MASLLELNVKDAPKLVTMPEGEYQLQIGKAEIKKSKNSNRDTFYLFFNIPTEITSKSVRHTFGLELEDGLPQKDIDDASRRLGDFLRAFSIEQTPLNNAYQEFLRNPSVAKAVPEYTGALGYGMLTIEEFEGRENNKVKYFITGA
jgi:hypothetical protein